MNTITFKSSDIHCSACAASIQNALGMVDGVQKVDVDLSNQTATIEFDPPATEDTVRAAFVEAGFEITG